MIDADCAVPTLHPAFNLNPVVGLHRTQFDPDRHDLIEADAFRPIEWISVRKFEWRRSVDADTGYSADIRTGTVRKVDEPTAPRYQYRIGSLAGQMSVPDDFDTMFKTEIEDMFGS